MINSDEEYHVKRILDERRKRWGRGYRHQYLIKWVGYDKPTWEPAREFKDTIALDEWEQMKDSADSEDTVIDGGIVT